MNWPINEVAELAGVTSRTLRHYDKIGLLRPVSTEWSGRRIYGQAELHRLQRILLLRELGLSLTAIGEVLDTGAEPVDALKAHLEWLDAEMSRLGRLAETVKRTIESIEKGFPMEAKDLLDGFDPGQYEAEARERWGDEVVDKANSAVSSIPPERWDELNREQQDNNRALAELMAEGVDPGDDRVLDLVARHFEWVTIFWTPDADAYRSLGEMYVSDERFTRHYDSTAPGLAAYLCSAMAVYSERRM